MLFCRIVVCCAVVLAGALPAQAVTVLFLGDSLTSGYGLKSDQAFPARVDHLLKENGYHEVTVINGGLSGSTSASGAGRLAWYGQMHPDIIFLALGANDGLRGLSTEQIRTNIQQTIGAAQKKNMRVILAGMEVPPNYGQKYVNDFRRVFRELAKENRVPFMPFLLKDVAGKPSLNQADGIHPNVQGQELIAKNVLPYILQELADKNNHSREALDGD